METFPPIPAVRDAATVTFTLSTPEPQAPVAERLYVVVADGEMVMALVVCPPGFQT